MMNQDQQRELERRIAEMIYRHDSNVVLEIDGRAFPEHITEELGKQIVGLVLGEAEKHSVGGFSFDDYAEHAYQNGYELTDEQVLDFMYESRRRFDASIGMNWGIMSDDLQEFVKAKGLEKNVEED
jgi:hypothetical protein